MHGKDKPEGAIAGERYAGIMPGRDGGASYQLFLLPGEADACRTGASRPCCMRP